MSINSKQKGNSFERQVAKILMKWTKTKWYRVGVSSGARGTREGIKDSRYNGDVFTEDEKYNDIVIECKSYKYLDINELFNLNSKFWKWINQTINESKGKKWLLFIKINHKGTFCLTNKMQIFLDIGICSDDIEIFNKSYISIFNDYHMVKIK